MKHGHDMHAKGLHGCTCLLLSSKIGMLCLPLRDRGDRLSINGTVYEVQAGILCDIRGILSWQLIERHPIYWRFDSPLRLPHLKFLFVCLFDSAAAGHG